jgi:flagellar FliJ protein
VSQAPQALSALLEQVQTERDEALSQFEQGRKAHENARQQLQSLHDFRQQYQDRWQQQFRQASGMEIMRSYQEFMNRLSEAESEQTRRVELAASSIERLRAVVIERERKVAAVTKLMERRASEQSLKEQRRDQKATDEMASRLHASNRSGPLSAMPASSSP